MGRSLVDDTKMVRVHNGRPRELARFVQVGPCLSNRSVPCRNNVLWLVGKCLFFMKTKQNDILSLVPFL